MGQAHIAQIRDPAKFIGVDAERQIESSHQARCIANFTRPMAGARPVGYAEIGWHANQADVDILERMGQRRTHEGRDFGIARLLHGVVFGGAGDIGFGIAHVVV